MPTASITPPGPVRRAWNSPTANTWASFLARSLGSLVLLPLALRHLPAEDFNLWALFSTLVGLSLLIDMGFCVTYVRALATSLAGAGSPAAFSRRAALESGSTPNWELLNRVVANMRFVYAALGWVYFGFLTLVGTLVLVRPIGHVADPTSAWLSWAITLAGGFLAFRSSYLSVLMQGLNEIVLLRRWDAVIALGSAVSGGVALLWDGSLLGLVLATQAWTVVGVWRNRVLSRRVAGGRLALLPAPSRDPELLRILWPATWRSGVGVLMSFGLIQATGLIQAQLVSPATSASYLLCLRILQQISAFSQAPFYSKLAVLPRLWASQRREELLEVTGRGMRWSLWSYVTAYCAAGLLGPPLLRLIGSAVPFPRVEVFVLFGIVFGIERYAAMHLNFYNITNDVITHIANGLTGLLCIVFVLIFWTRAGDLALPLGLLAGYCAFYAWYPVRLAYREFGMNFWRWEAQHSLGPAIFFIVSSAVLWKVSS
jgi:hypothetical protein